MVDRNCWTPCHPGNRTTASPCAARCPPRATGVLLGLTATLNPFSFHPSYRPAPQACRFDERVAEMRKPRGPRSTPQTRKRRMTEGLVVGDHHELAQDVPVWATPPTTSPRRRSRSRALAEAQRKDSPQEIAYDVLLEKDGRALIYHPLFNYIDRRPLARPTDARASRTRPSGLSDAWRALRRDLGLRASPQR